MKDVADWLQRRRAGPRLPPGGRTSAELTWIGEGAPTRVDGAGPALPRDVQKKLDRKMAKRRARSEIRPLEEVDVPPGSKLSDKTLADIRAGHYGILLTPPRQLSPIRPWADAARRRRKLAKASRRRNRGK